MTPIEQKKFILNQKNNFSKSNFRESIGSLVLNFIFHPESESIAKSIIKKSKFSNKKDNLILTKDKLIVENLFKSYCNEFHSHDKFYCVLPNVSICDQQILTQYPVLLVTLDVLKVCANLSMKRSDFDFFGVVSIENNIKFSISCYADFPLPNNEFDDGELYEVLTFDQ